MYVTYEPKQFYKVERRKVGANLIYQCNGPYDRAPHRIPNGLPKPDFMPCKLLRISDMQIVDGSKVQEGYCALSYSWSWCGNNVMDKVKGKARRVDEGKHRIVWRAKKVPKKPRGRKHVSRKTKFVVFEGIIQQIGKDFNVKYIWYDQWCIDQNNKEEKHREIKRMHKIYSNAYCAIALIPELVAKKNKEQNRKYPFRYYADSNLIFSSDWFSRVWTLEEAIMSQKILFVGQNVHFWENVARGDIDFRALLQRPVRLNVAMVLYHAHRRETTKEHDRIFALANIFPGILDSLHVSYSQPLHDAMIQFYGLLAKQDLSILCFGEYDHYKRTFLERKYWYKSTLPSSVANWYQNVPIRKHDLPSWSGVFGEHLICSDLKSLWKTDFQNYNVIGRTMEIKTSFLSSSSSSTTTTFIDHHCNINKSTRSPTTKIHLPPLPVTNNNNAWWILGITVKLPGHTKVKIIPLFSVLGEFDEIDYDELIENVTPKFRLLSHFLPINKEQLIWHNSSTASKKAYTRFTFNLTETIDDSSPRCTLLSGIPFKQNSDDDLRLYPVIQQDGNHYKAIVSSSTRTLEAIQYTRGNLQILNQLALPHETIFEPVINVQDGHAAIKTMKTRGAPAIAIVAALSLAVDAHARLENNEFKTVEETKEFLLSSLEYLKTSRPTAVNLFDTAAKFTALVDKVQGEAKEPKDLVQPIIEAAEKMLIDDVQDNKNIGKHGAEYIVNNVRDKSNISVLTHCNTGSLATAGWGTALGIVRDLHRNNQLKHAFCTETRPYNQGSRLTAYELVYESIPSTLICDSMASALLRLNPSVQAIIVGADRVAANGDTANKIGTYQLAITAKHHGILFVVAAPSTSIDLSMESGKEIVIEERPANELVTTTGVLLDNNQSTAVRTAAQGINVWNPSFDVTPSELISAIVTEKGVAVKQPGLTEFDLKSFLS